MIAGLMVRLRLEPEPRRAAGAAGTGARATPGGADDDLLTFLELAAQHLGGRAVADAERERHRLDLVAVEHPDAPGSTATRIAAAAGLATGGGVRLVVFRALLGREEFPDARARRLADLAGLLAALLIGQALQRYHLLAAVGQDRVELLLLLRGEAERLHEPLADLLRRGPPTRSLAAAAALRRLGGSGAARDGGGPGIAAGRAVAQRGVRDLQHARLLGHDHLHVRRHAGQQPAAGIVDGHHDGVGDDVLDDLGRLADLHDRPRELLAREGVHGERGAV